MILAGDVGGTNIRLALFDRDSNAHLISQFPSRNYPSEDGMQRVVAEYVASIQGSHPNLPLFDRACFGVAGPVKQEDGQPTAKITNLPWRVQRDRLASTLRLLPERVSVINDLAANAEGVAVVKPEKLVTLQQGEVVEGHRAIISAGTGLGEAGLFWNPKAKRHFAFPSEGGHSSFGPRNALETDLWRYLAGTDVETFKGHVSWERVLSGPGLFNIFDFLRHSGIGTQSIQLPEGTSPGDAAKVISKAGLEGSCDRSGQALDLFVSFYGAAAGNLALTFLSLGGLYVGGGIAPKIIQKLTAPYFMEAFLDKGPFRSRVLEKIPVHVILDEHTALRGAARYAAEQL